MRQAIPFVSARRMAAALVVVLLGLPAVAAAATTYTWNVATGLWTDAASWSPNRTTPAADDILVFDGGVTATAGVSGVPLEVFGQLHLTNGVAVTFLSGVGSLRAGTISKTGGTITGVGTSFMTDVVVGDIVFGNTALQNHEITTIASGTSMTVTLGGNYAAQAWSLAPRLQPSGGPGEDLVIGSGSSLTISSSTPISIFVRAGATSRIEGSLTFAGNVHRLHAESPGAITVAAGGVITQDVGYTGNPFTGTGPANVITFQSGSTFVQNSGANAFGLAQPASKVVFQTGSLYRFQAPGAMSLSGRTYADVEISTTISAATTGSPFIMNNLTILSGGIEVTGVIQPILRGNLTVATGGVFRLIPPTLATATSPNFSGTTTQTISGGGDIQFGQFCNVFIANPAGVVLNRDVTMNGVVFLVNGNIATTGSNTLQLGTTATLTAGTRWIAGNLRRDIAATGASVTLSFPVGDATAATPVSVTFPAGNTAGSLTVSTTPGDHPSLTGSGLDPARGVNRYWTLTPAGGLTFGSADATLNYIASDLDPGASPFIVRAGKFDTPTWSSPTLGPRTATSIQVTGLTSFSDLVAAEPVVAGADLIAPAPGSACISNATACAAVPVVWTRTDATPARGYSVTIELSPNLSLCGAQFTSGGYLLAGSGGTSFLVTPLGGNQYTIDEVTLGNPCGATGNGTLFTAFVTSADLSGTGTITVLSATARDCDNLAIPANPGVAATIPIDKVSPAAVALSATQLKTGNVQPPNGTTDVVVSWGGQELGSTVQVYRKGFGGYPQYDENGGLTPTAPATPAAALGAGWTLTGVTTSGGADRTGARDFYYYVAFATDGCGNVSAVSNQSGGTLNYHLGDVHDGLANCAGNDLVNTADVSFLGANYGITIPVNGPLECLDVGPTTNFGVDARPSTDNKTNFEDLVVFAINFGNVSAPQARAVPVAAGANTLRLDVPLHPAVGETFAVGLALTGTGSVQAFTSTIGYDPAVVEFLGVEAGPLMAAQAAPGVALSAGPGNVDVAMLGAGHGIMGQGVIARARFRMRGAGAPAIVLRSVDARDAENQPAILDAGTAPVVTVAPGATALAPARPTPFRDATVLEYALAREGPVELVIHGIDGRRVRTLERAQRGPGVYRVSWDGRDAHGAQVAAGVYYARLVTAEGRQTRTLVRLR